MSIDGGAAGARRERGRRHRLAMAREGGRLASRRDQPLVEVTTDKVDAEIPSPSAGVVETILAAEGDVGRGRCRARAIDADAGRAPRPRRGGGSARRPDARLRTAAAPAAARRPARAPAAGQGRAEPRGRRRSRGASPKTRASNSAASRARRRRRPRHEGRRRAPRAAAPAAAAAPAEARARPRPRRAARGARAGLRPLRAAGGRPVIPMSPLRRIIAEHMVYSKRTSPHVGTVAEVDLAGVVRAARRAQGRLRASHGITLTFLPVHRACDRARAARVPGAECLGASRTRSSRSGTSTSASPSRRRRASWCRWCDTPIGSRCPGSRRRSTTSRRARATSGSRPTICRAVPSPSRIPVAQGNLYGFAIINQPQVGILRMGEIVKRPVVRDARRRRRHRDPPDDAPRALLRSPRGRWRSGERLPVSHRGAARRGGVRPLSAGAGSSATLADRVARAGSLRGGARQPERAVEARRRGGRGRRLLLLEHPPVVTLGRCVRRGASAARPATDWPRGASRSTRSRAAATSPITRRGSSSATSSSTSPRAARGTCTAFLRDDRGGARAMRSRRSASRRGSRAGRPASSSRDRGPPRKIASIGVGLRRLGHLARLRAERDRRLSPASTPSFPAVCTTSR